MGEMGRTRYTLDGASSTATHQKKEVRIMAEYIERENAYKLISEQKEKAIGMYSKGRNDGLDIAKSIIHSKEKCPTADVVEVVRCKDCTEWDEKECKCSRWYGFRENDFCSHGVRRSDVE